MAWSEAQRIASFVSLTAGQVPVVAMDTSLDGSRERNRMLGAVLWLELGVRIGYFTRTGAGRVLETLRPAFEGIYEWLEVHARALSPGLVDDVLRIRGEGLSVEPLRGAPPAEIAELHFRHGLVVMGGYLSGDQGLWSQLAGAIMFASDDAWQSILATVEESAEPDVEVARPFIDDAPGLLRCMDASLIVSNSAARDERLNALQQEQLSIALLTLFSWPLSLAEGRPRDRFSAVYSALTARVIGDLDAAPLASQMQSDIDRLRDAWMEIDQDQIKLGVQI